ncbi:ATP-binding protein [Anaerotardibacter muris]|uniref:ATP-binding protein n=1 Tax=Anaerotardibacter muris TaxID=2941505 RepID=UPI00203B07AC|nr:AAA family ATPase [Anaerotardibacter muris]
MNEVKLSNIPTVSVEQVIDELSGLYIAALQSGTPFKTLPSVMLWGAPGVGKSQAIDQVARRIEKETDKKACVTDVRLLLFNPIDLRGIPTANAEKTLAVWLRPQIFDMDPGEDVVNLLFLDEITAAPQSVQAAAYQITLDRVVGEHVLPDNCIVIAAGNRTTDKSVSFKMPKALANRLMHFQVEESFEAWRAWAVKAGINGKAIAFLSFRKDYLMLFDSGSSDVAFATPRSWEMVSKVLDQFDGDVDRAFNLVAGLVGVGVALEFRSWDSVYDSLPSIDEIFDGKNPDCPTNTDALYALVSAILEHARLVKDDLDKMANAIRYADKMPPDFSTILMKDFMALEEGYREKLIMVPEFSQWLRTKGVLLNGS